MTEKGDVELDLLLAGLVGDAPDNEGDAEYPLPEKKPVKFTNVDVIVMPKGYKSEYPKPEDSKPRFSDSLPSMKLDVADAEETDGVLSIPAVVANAKHIYDYDGLKVRKPFEELEAAALFADGIPITREHPPAGVVTDRGQVLGFFKGPVAKDDMLKGILTITDKDLIADVKDKKLTEVSAGFFCDLDDTLSGEFEGEHYDATQKNVFLNHIAVVENGRCNIDDGCGIGLDATQVPQDIMSKLEAAIDRAKAMEDKSLLHTLEAIKKELSVSKEGEKDSGDSKKTVDANALNLVKLKDAFTKLTAERDSLRDEVGKIVKAEKDSLTAELINMQDSKTKEDLEKLTLDDLQKELDMVKGIKAKRLSVPDSSRSSGRISIDDAYGKIGLEGGK